MRLWLFAMSYWHDKTMADAHKKIGLFSLPEWKERVERLFQPDHIFLASGTYSDPSFNPINCPVVNAGVTWDLPAGGYHRNYAKCAFTAAMAYALNKRNEWDLLIHLDNDCFLGSIDLDWLIREFWKRPEIICCAGTNCSAPSNPEGPLTLWKAEGAARLLHYRQSPNLLDSDESSNLAWDQECGYIYRNGRWWNPWPDVKDVVHVGDDATRAGWDEMLTWPMVVKPTPLFAERYIETHRGKTKPFMP